MEDWQFLGLDAPEFVTESGHLVWGGMPIELEMAVLLYGLVRYQKPDLVVESGTGSGRSTFVISRALQANGKGRVVTFEAQDEFRERANEMFEGNPFVQVRDGLAREASLNPDLVFVDTGADVGRQEEVDFWVSHPGRPIVVVHDGNRGYGLEGHRGVNVVGHDGVWIGRDHASKETV